MSLSAGTRLGPYEVLSPLGSGGMGEVYRARDTRLGREVAVKVLPASFSADPDRLKRFEQEARAAGMLSHPNITVLHDIGSHGGAPYVVSELLEGETLRSRLAAGALPPKRAIEYAIQIAHGLAAAHQKGIVHRDLKPENLFLTKDGRVKVLDFGLAKLTHPERQGMPASELPTATAAGTEAGIILGTIGYMSPEQVRGQTVDPRSDIFALGAVLYEMLTGKRAFSGATAADVMTAILTAETADLPAEISGVTPVLERIVRHCLEKSAEQRFQSAQDAAFALESLPAISGPSPVAATASAPPRRGRTSAVLMILLPLLTLTGGLLLGGRLGKAPPANYLQLTYRRGSITSARFAPDGQTILYSAAWGGDPLQGFLKRPEAPDAVGLGPPGAALLSISRSGELALALDCKSAGRFRLCSGTLAKAPLAGGSPRELLEHVQQADWAADGSALVVVRDFEGKSRLEFPPGKVLYETRGHVSYPRLSPDANAIAFLDHPHPINDMGSAAVVSLSGEKKRLTGEWETAQGLAWAPSGKEIWFSAANGSTRGIYGVSLSGKQRLVARAPGFLRLHDVFRDGRALVSRDTVEFSAFALAPGKTAERDLSWLEMSFPRVLSPDGKILLFDEESAPAGANYAACLRRTDGSPVVRLGDGYPMSLSPDGKWVLTRASTTSKDYVLLPTGAGEPRRIIYEGIEESLGGRFSPDGNKIVFLARQGQEPFRFYRGSLKGGKPRALTPPAGGPGVPSPDGRRMMAMSNGVPAIFSLEAGPDTPPGPIPGATPDDRPLQWSEDGRSVYLRQRPGKIFRIDLETGTRTFWKEIKPSDPSGATIETVLMTPDAKAYAYGLIRDLSQLYLVEGLK